MRFFLLALLLTACASQPTTQQLQVDAETAAWWLKAAGCATSVAGAVAAPAVQAYSDQKGNTVLQVAATAGTAACTMTLPPTAGLAP
jgi:protein involved in polysaccharide export with SLBB domain